VARIRPCRASRSHLASMASDSEYGEKVKEHAHVVPSLYREFWHGKPETLERRSAVVSPIVAVPDAPTRNLAAMFALKLRARLGSRARRPCAIGLKALPD